MAKTARTETKTYVVRNGSLFLSDDLDICCVGNPANAAVFGTPEAASKHIKGPDSVYAGREILELSYGLRWATGGAFRSPRTYARTPACDLTMVHRHEAHRFPSLQAARDARPATLRMGACAFDVDSGYVIVRFLKKVGP